MSVNWLLVLLIALAFVLVRLAVTGRYRQVGAAIVSIPLTPAQAQAQTDANAASFTTSGVGMFNRIG